jgi:hypothetical protein
MSVDDKKIKYEKLLMHRFGFRGKAMSSIIQHIDTMMKRIHL